MCYQWCAYHLTPSSGDREQLHPVLQPRPGATQAAKEEEGSQTGSCSPRLQKSPAADYGTPLSGRRGGTVQQD